MDNKRDFIIRIHYSEHGIPMHLIIVEQHNDDGEEKWVEISKAYDHKMNGKELEKAHNLFKRLIGE